MSDKVKLDANGNWTYGPEGYTPTLAAGVRWVTGDEIAAGNIGYWQHGLGSEFVLFQPGMLAVVDGQTPTQNNVFSTGYDPTNSRQVNDDKVNRWVQQYNATGTSSIPLTPQEQDIAGGIVADYARGRELERNLGGYEQALRWLAGADAQTNSQIAQWVNQEQTDQANQDAAAAAAAQSSDSQAAADDTANDPNLDNTDQNAQTGDMGDDYYSDEEWYADQMATQDYSQEYNYGDYATQDSTGYTEADYNTIATDNTDYSDYGYQDLGGGQWYDPSDNSTYDESTGEWTYADNSSSIYDTIATDNSGDYTSQGLEDLGDNMWFNPNDGSVYDADTGVTTPGWAEQDSFVDPFSGTTFYADGSFMLPDGTTVTSEGNYVFEDGTTLLQNGDYVDANGQTWESMAYAGAPNVWQNTATGDTWNMNDGTYVPAQFAPAVEGGDRISYDQFLAQQKQSDPANYVRLTQPTTRPGGSSGGGGGGGSGVSLGGGGKAAGAAGGVTLADLNKLLQTAAVATQAVVTAKNSGAPANQLAALQRTAQQTAQAAASAKAAGISTGNIASPISAFLKTNSTTLLIAGAALAALLLITGRKSTPTPAANVAA